MIITKRELRRIIKEERDRVLAERMPGSDRMPDPHYHPAMEPPGVHVASEVEDGYVNAIRKLGARSVVRSMLDALAKHGVGDADHHKMLKVLEHEG